MKVKSLSRVRLFTTPWTVAYQAPLPMGFSRQEYWSVLPCLSPKASGCDEIPVELFRILKMMLWKCCTQYASKFGKLSSGYRTGKDQFSFQSQRKAMPKNVQTTEQLSQMVKHLSAMQETRVRSLGWGDPLEKEMAAHSNILAWKIPWREEPDGLQSTRLQKVTSERLESEANMTSVQCGWWIHRYLYFCVYFLIGA